MNLTSIVGSAVNTGVEAIRNMLFSHGPGKVTMSNRNSEKSSGIIITDDIVSITSPSSNNGVKISDNAVAIQGVVSNTAKGDNLKKGEYSENPRAAKIYTYQETILTESIPKELAATAAGLATGLNSSTGIAGTNQSVGMDGAIPIITDVSAGPAPHFHTITMKHVHRIEPTYLYRIPSILNVLMGASDQLKNFYSA